MAITIIYKFSFLRACKIIIFLSLLIILYHLLIVFSIIPYKLVWGGKLKSYNQMLMFEAISIIINCLIILVVLIKSGYIKRLQSPRLIKFALWFFVILFALNTIGNLFAENLLEKIVFTPITLIVSLLFYRLAIEERSE